MHVNLVGSKIFQILMDIALVSRSDQSIPGLLGLVLCLVLTWAAYTAAYTGHAFDKVSRQFAHLHKEQGFLALSRAIALHNLRLNVLAHLLKALKHRGCDTAAVAETLAKDRTFLIIVLSGSSSTPLARIMARISPNVMA